MIGFMYCEVYKYETFAMAEDGNIWRFYFDYGQIPYMQKCIGNEPEFVTIFALLRAKMNLYR